MKIRKGCPLAKKELLAEFTKIKRQDKPLKKDNPGRNILRSQRAKWFIPNGKNR